MSGQRVWEQQLRDLAAQVRGGTSLQRKLISCGQAEKGQVVALAERIAKEVGVYPGTDALSPGGVMVTYDLPR